MKKIILLGALAAFSYGQAQTAEMPVMNATSEAPVRQNDVMISPVGLIVGIFSGYYERLVTPHSGVGLSTSFMFSNHVFKEGGPGFAVLPYYRYYAGKKYANGFFVEGFTGLTTLKVQYYSPAYVVNNGIYSSFVFPPAKEENRTGFAIGFGLGGKWAFRNNLLLEVSSGIGYATIQDVDTPLFVKGILGLGYRF